MQVTKRQDKVLKTIDMVKTRLAKLEALTPEQYVKKYKRDLFWFKIDIKQYKEQLEDNFKKLEEAKRLDAKEEAKLNAKQAKEDDYEALLQELPQVIKDFLEGVRSASIKSERENHEFWLDQKCPVSESYANSRKYREARDTWSYHHHFYDEAKVIAEINESIKDMTIDLMHRVTAKVGKIVDAKHLRVQSGSSTSYGCNTINGIIYGEKDTAVIQSIFAGGFNIQRFHVRVLVK